MKNSIRTAILIAAIVPISGCVPSPEAYRTQPVTLKTPKGEIVCQLYTPDRVLWDEAISAPPGMSISEADELCREEGYRRLPG